MLASVGTAIALAAPAVYIRSVLKGRTRPHRTTWLVYSVITVTTAASVWANQGAGSFLLAGAEALQAVIVFLLSLRYGVDGWTRPDLACLFVAAAALVVWAATGSPSLGLLLLLVADLAGTVPTLVKTWKWPASENAHFYGLDALAALLVLASGPRWAGADLVYPAYMLGVNLLVVLLVTRPRWGSGPVHA